MKCIISVFDIALHSEIDHFGAPKIFILLSTIMTWAMTKPADTVSALGSINVLLAYTYILNSDI